MYKINVKLPLEALARNERNAKFVRYSLMYNVFERNQRANFGNITETCTLRKIQIRKFQFYSLINFIIQTDISLICKRLNCKY